LCSYNTSKIPPVGVGSGAWHTCLKWRNTNTPTQAVKSLDRYVYMNLGELSESLNSVEIFAREKVSILEDLKARKDKLREEIERISPIRKVKGGKYLSVGAVDSSFDELFGDDWGRRLYAVCVSGIGFTPNGFTSKKPEWQIEGLALGYEEEDDYKRILRGFSLAKEIHSAKEWFSNMDLVLIDGSAKSSIISINQAMTSKDLEKSNSGKKLKTIYKETLSALYDMLDMGMLVFIPKRSSEVFIANKVSSTIKNDYAVLEAALEPGEYIIIDSESVSKLQHWDYTLPKVDSVTEDLLSKLFSLLKNLKVIYFKSRSGRIEKLETYTPLSANTLWDFFILEGENILAYLTDRSAKEYLKLLKKYARLINPRKYRM